MNEQRKQILEMVAEGKITVEEAERLIDALDDTPAGMPVDLTRLKPEDIDELIDHLGEMTVEVQEHENKVHVFCE